MQRSARSAAIAKQRVNAALPPSAVLLASKFCIVLPLFQTAKVYIGFQEMIFIRGGIMANEHIKKFFESQGCTALTFNDVLLVPQHSTVVPKDTSLETRITKNVKLKIPIASADMDTVTEAKMAIAMAKSGGIGFIHRNMSIARQAEEVDKVKFTLNALIEKPVCLNEGSTLEDYFAIVKKYDERFSSFIITDSEGQLKGLITKDQVKFFTENERKNARLPEVMLKNPFSIDRKVDVGEAYKLMREKRLSKLIITDEKGKVTGLYCWTDVKNIVENANPMFNRNEKGNLIVGASIGVHDYARAEALLKKGVDIILVGTAHGDSDNVGNTVTELKKNFSSYKFDVLAGNVATKEGAEYLKKCGADGIKVGIGPGSICTTRIISGFGVPQLTAVYYSCLGAEDIPVCADGGLKYSGDMAKAIAVGASAVMCGSLFAATQESPGEVQIVQGKPFKVYRGMGSLEAMKDHRQSQERYKQSGSLDKLVPEGVTGTVPMKGKVEDMLFQLAGGIRSSLGYGGAKDISEFQSKSKLVVQTNSGQIESHPHDINITSEPPNYQK